MNFPRQAQQLASLVALALLAVTSRNAFGQSPARTPGDLVITEKDDGKAVDALLDQTIAINLKGNPSTGFEWLLTETAGDSVAADGLVRYLPDEPGGVGVGGTYSFPFRAVRQGPTSLSFDYRQPWNPSSTLRTFSVTIEVAGADVPPRLSIVLEGGNVVLRWPQAKSEGYFLEGTPRLQPASWAALNVLPLPEGDQYRVTLGPSGSQLFFRLHK